jgi:hypothetical protein
LEDRRTAILNISALDGTIVLDIAISPARIAAGATKRRNMKTLRLSLLLLAISILCSAPVWADSIEYDVNSITTITAPLTCPSCVENIAVSFLWQNNVTAQGWGQVVNGSMDVSSSGFLGTFQPSILQGDNFFYVGLFNNSSSTYSSSDEIDMYYGTLGTITQGSSVHPLFWGCQTTACTTAYGESWFGVGPPSNVGTITQSSIIVTPVTVPDGDSPLLLMVSALGAVGVAYRWRGQDLSS